MKLKGYDAWKTRSDLDDADRRHGPARRCEFCSAPLSDDAWAEWSTDGEPLFVEVGRLLDGKPSEDVIPTLITLAARMLMQEADGNIDKLSTLLLRFCRLVQNEASDMLLGERDA